MIKHIAILLAAIVAIALVLFGGYLSPVTISVMPAQTETKALPQPVKAPLPEIPQDNPALAQAAESIRTTVRQLHTSKTGSDLKHRKDAIRQQTKTLQAGGADSIPVIKALLADPRPDVRVKAVGVLGGMDRSVGVPVLAATVIAESHKPTRLQALMYLSQTRPRGEEERAVLIEQTRQALLRGLADSDLEIRKAAARAVLCIAGTLGQFKADGDEAEREAALIKLRGMLGEIGLDGADSAGQAVRTGGVRRKW